MLATTEDWICTSGHPASHLRFETTTTGDQARIMQDGEALYGPSTDTELVYAEYNRQVQEFIDYATS